MKRIGILGGTFDPIHYGHLVAADVVCEALDLDTVLFVPCGYPPHKDPSQAAPAEHRYLMTVLATTGYPRFRVSRVELDRPGPSYTVDTVRALTQDQGAKEWYLIVGADAFLDMPSWKEPETIMSLVRLAVISRQGYDDQAVSDRIATLPERFRDRVHHLTAFAPQISSHQLRAWLKAGEPIDWYVPSAVVAYIKQHGLYTA